MLNRLQFLLKAAQQGDHQTVNNLLRQDVPTSVLTEALRSAATNGHLKVVECLAGTGANARFNGDAAFCGAATHGHLDVVEFLLSKGAAIDAKKGAALRGAASNGHFKVVKYLLAYGADTENINESVLRAIRLQGHSGVAKLLESAKQGEDFENINEPVEMAKQSSQSLTPKTDLDSKKEVTTVNEDEDQMNDETMALSFELINAAGEGDYDKVETLISKKANIHMENEAALSAAAAKGSLGTVELLVKNGANSRSEAALCAAASRNKIRVVEFLVANGTDIQASGGAALRVAMENEHKDVADFLLVCLSSSTPSDSEGLSRRCGM